VIACWVCIHLNCNHCGCAFCFVFYRLLLGLWKQRSLASTDVVISPVHLLRWPINISVSELQNLCDFYITLPFKLFILA